MFIVFEGVDHSGKSTQIKLLADHLKACGRNCAVVQFPDRSTALGKMIGTYLRGAQEFSDESVHLLFSANRWEKKDFMCKALKQSEFLLADRYIYSGCAYSMAKGLEKNWCLSCDAGLPLPKLVVYLYAEPTTLVCRFGEKERYEDLEFQERVALAYKELSSPNWLCISAEASVASVHSEILNGLRSRGVNVDKI